MNIVGYKIPAELTIVSMCGCGGHLWVLCTNGRIYQVESICEKTTTWPEEDSDDRGA